MNQWNIENDISRRDDFHDLLAWIKASQKRVDILTSLDDSPKNSTEFAESWDTTIEAVQYHLKLLQKGGSDKEFPALVEIVTPDRQRYRLWGLTAEGEDLVEYLE